MTIPLTCECLPPTHRAGCPAATVTGEVVDFTKLVQMSQSVGARFVAAFTNKDGCPECGGLMEEGDEVGYVDDVVVCGDCHDLARR
jgi:hypothetical protein